MNCGWLCSLEKHEGECLPFGLVGKTKVAANATLLPFIFGSRRKKDKCIQSLQNTRFTEYHQIVDRILCTVAYGNISNAQMLYFKHHKLSFSWVTREFSSNVSLTSSAWWKGLEEWRWSHRLLPIHSTKECYPLLAWKPLQKIIEWEKREREVFVPDVTLLARSCKSTFGRSGDRLRTCSTR